MTTTTTFDVGALRDAIEAADVEGQIRLYAEEAEVTVADRDHPPSEPIRLQGREQIRSWLDDLCGRDMTHVVTIAHANERSGGYSLQCQYASGERVSCAAVFEVEGGRISRLEGVQAWDA
jgi:hypothetical protein